MAVQPSLPEEFFSAIQEYTDFLLEKRVVINFHQCRFVCNLVQAMCRTLAQMRDSRLSVEMHTICTAAICLLQTMGGTSDGPHRVSIGSRNGGRGGGEASVKNSKLHTKEEEEALLNYVSHVAPFYATTGSPVRVEEEGRQRGAPHAVLHPTSTDAADCWSDEDRSALRNPFDWGFEASNMPQRALSSPKLEGDVSSSSSSLVLLFSSQSVYQHRHDVGMEDGWPFVLLHHFTCEAFFQGWISRYQAGWKLLSPTEIMTSWKEAVEMDKRKNAELLRQWFQPTIGFLQRHRRRYIAWMPGKGEGPHSSSPRPTLTTAFPQTEHLQERTEKFGGGKNREEQFTDDEEKKKTNTETVASFTVSIVNSTTADDRCATMKEETTKAMGRPRREEEEEDMETEEYDSGEVLNADGIISFYSHPQHNHWRVLYEDLDYVTYPSLSPTTADGEQKRSGISSMDRVCGTITREKTPLTEVWEEEDDMFQDFRGGREGRGMSSFRSSPLPSVPSAAARKQIPARRGREGTEREREPHFVLQRGLSWHHLPVLLQRLEEAGEEEEGRGRASEEEKEERKAVQRMQAQAVRESSIFFVEEAVLRCQWVFPGLVRYFGAFTEKLCSTMEEAAQRSKSAQEALRLPSPQHPDLPSGWSSSFHTAKLAEEEAKAKGSVPVFTSSSPYSRCVCPSPSYTPVASPQGMADPPLISFSAPRLCLGLLREDLENREEEVRKGEVGAEFASLWSLLYHPEWTTPFTPSEVVEVMIQLVEIVQYLAADCLHVPQEVWCSWMTLSPSCVYVRRRRVAVGASPYPIKMQRLLHGGALELFRSSMALRYLKKAWDCPVGCFRQQRDPMGGGGVPTSTPPRLSSSSTPTATPWTSSASDGSRRGIMEKKEVDPEGEWVATYNKVEEDEGRGEDNGQGPFFWEVKYAPPCYVSNGAVSRWRPHPKARSISCYALAQLFLALWTHQQPYDEEWFHQSAHASMLHVSSILWGEKQDDDEDDDGGISCAVKEGVLPGMLFPASLSPAGRELCRQAMSLDQTSAPMTLEGFKEALLCWESENMT